MKKHFFLLLILALLSMNAAAQTANYDDMLALVKGGSLSVDFKVMRFAFANKVPAEARVADPKLQAQMATLLNEKKYKDVVKIADGIHKTTFVDMNSHIMAAMAYKGLGDAKKAAFHEGIYLNLVNSILKDTDGESPKKAYHVISIAEQFVLLNALELKRVSNKIEVIDGHRYQVHDVTDNVTNDPLKIYFNIDRIPVTMAPVPKN